MSKTQVILNKIIIRLFLLAFTVFVGVFAYSLVNINAASLAVCLFMIYMLILVTFLFEEQKMFSEL